MFVASRDDDADYRNALVQNASLSTVLPQESHFTHQCLHQFSSDKSNDTFNPPLKCASSTRPNIVRADVFAITQSVFQRARWYSAVFSLSVWCKADSSMHSLINPKITQAAPRVFQPQRSFNIVRTSCLPFDGVNLNADITDNRLHSALPPH